MRDSWTPVGLGGQRLATDGQGAIRPRGARIRHPFLPIAVVRPTTRLVWIACLAVAACAAFVIGAPDRAEAALSGGNGLIAFQSNRLGGTNYDIMVMQPAPGATQTNLTAGADGGRSDEAPSWLPDGASLLFSSRRQAASGFSDDIYIMGANGSSPTPLTNSAASETHPTTSSNGSKIVYRSTATGGEDTYIMNVDGSGQQVVGSNPVVDTDPSISPDGSRIAFMTRRGAAGSWEIYTMSTAGGAVTNLTSTSPFDDIEPDWSPDGTKIAFVSTEDGTDFEIFTMNADGSGRTQRTFNTAVDTRPAWSPDGTRIAFNSNLVDPANNDIYVLNVDAPAGTPPTRLTTDPAADLAPAWQPTDPYAPPLDVLAGRNVKPPTIIESGVTAGRSVYRCTDGTWEGLVAPPDFVYTWWVYRQSPFVFDGTPEVIRQVGTGPTLSPDPAYWGQWFFCRVEARTISVTGRTMATSAPAILTGFPKLDILFAGNPYGDFRVRGIDVFQTVQPNSSARRFTLPDGAFPSFCGGGTPTPFRPYFKLSCRAGPDPGRTTYAGVTLDMRKSATAIVYVNMVKERASSPTQPLNVTLRARLGGRLLPTSVTLQIVNPVVSTSRWVTRSERAGTSFGVQFSVPPSWLASAVLSGQRLDIEALAELPLGAGYGALTECDMTVYVTAAALCSASDDRFRLDGVAVADDLAELTVSSLPLVRKGQNLNPPQQVLARVVDLFPGGERLNILPYTGQVNIQSATDLVLSDGACKPFRAVADDPATPAVNETKAADLRGCRSAAVSQAVTTWLATPANATGYQVLLAVHNYSFTRNDGTVAAEPGWSRGSVATPDAPARLTVNDGSANRPLTAAGHEFGHALTAPHADSRPPDAAGNPTPDPLASGGCRGNFDGQVGEAWPPDNSGRLQGTAFGHSSVGTRTNVPVVDSDTKLPEKTGLPLFDLMSYCAVEGDAWLSAFNWGRFMSVLRDLDALGRARADHEHGAATSHAAPVAGTGFAVGAIGSAGASISSVVPPDPGNRVPAPDPASTVRVRSFDAAGRPLGETGVAILSDHLDGHAPVLTYLAPVPAAASAVSVISGGVQTDLLTRTLPPSVRVLAPRAGSRVGGGAKAQFVVRWTTNDPDTPAKERTVSIAYARDGRTFVNVYRGADTGRATIPARLLSSSNRARVRVAVSDGFNQTSARSGVFSAAGSDPTVRITRPTAGEQLNAGTGALLVGSAFDDRQRPLTGRSLTWFIGARRLGGGELLRVSSLPAGRATLRLVARDEAGRTTATTRRIRVAPITLALTTLRSPAKVRASAGRVTITVATTTPATLRAGGRTFRIGPSARKLSIPVRAGPRGSIVRLDLRITARGVRQKALRETVVLLRT